MDMLSRQLFPGVAGAIFLALTLTGLAQPTPVPAEKSAPPAAEPPPAPTAAPEADRAAAPEKSPADKSQLRRLDQVEPTPDEPRERFNRRRNRNGSGEFPFGDHTVPEGSRMRDVVSILGSTTVEGEIDSDAVSVGGGTFIGRGGKVGGAAVSVLGRLESEGDIRDEAVSVLGSARINGHVGGEAVSVLGNMHLGPNAVIDGDIVVVGGRLTKDPKAIVHGNEVRVPMLGAFGDFEWLTIWVKRCLVYGRPLALGEGLGWAWSIAFSFFAFYVLLALLFSQGIVKCAETLETRPGRSVLASVLTVLLSPVVVVLLAVTVVGALLVPFLGAGLLFAKLFGKAVMLAWIGRRFTKFFGGGPLSHPAVGVLIGGMLVLGLYTIPIVGFLTYQLLTWLGLGVVVYTIVLSMKRDRPPVAGDAASLPPEIPVAPDVPAEASASAVPVESVPSASFAAMGMTAAPAVAAPSVSPGFSGSSAGSVEMPALPEVGPPPVPPSGMRDDFSQGPLPLIPPVTPPTAASVPPPMTPPSRPSIPTAPALPAAVVWRRAGFFIRLGALALDGILIGLIVAFVSGMLPRFLRFHDGPGGWLIALALYGAVMWKHKGTTIGGIVCGLKVVRVDNREIDWATAIVRALGCFLSLAVAGLGFIWVAIDDEKQSWHDKIAGTTVVHVPKGVSLL